MSTFADAAVAVIAAAYPTRKRLVFTERFQSILSEQTATAGPAAPAATSALIKQLPGVHQEAVARLSGATAAEIATLTVLAATDPDRFPLLDNPAVAIPGPIPDNETQAWRLLGHISQQMPSGWTLIGGQLVQLHCWQRGTQSPRVTDDTDVLVNVRANPQGHREFTAILASRDFVLAGSDPLTGKAHRWVCADIIVDVLVPDHVGHRNQFLSVAGTQTLGAPAGSQALDRTQAVRIRIPDDIRDVIIFRPDLLASLVGKAAAYGITSDRERERHLEDFVTLAGLISDYGLMRSRLAQADRKRIATALGAVVHPPLDRLWNLIPNGATVRARLTAIIA